MHVRLCMGQFVENITGAPTDQAQGYRMSIWMVTTGVVPVDLIVVKNGRQGNYVIGRKLQKERYQGRRLRGFD